MLAGSAAQILLAWRTPSACIVACGSSSMPPLSSVRRRGWAQSIGEREPGVASVSAGVRSPSGKMIAAVSVSGPIEQDVPPTGRIHAPAVLAAAERLSESLRRSGD